MKPKAGLGVITNFFIKCVVDFKKVMENGIRNSKC